MNTVSNTTATATDAVLMMAYGSPDSLDDIGAYLADIRGGRPTKPEFIAEIRDRYARIGGSPLNTRTDAQAIAVEAELRRRGLSIDVYVGMRHWQPWISDAVTTMQANGVKRAVGIVMAPFYAQLHTGQYRKAVLEANDAGTDPIDFRFVSAWATEPKFIETHRNAIRATLATIQDDTDLHLLFTAHSLPRALIAENDPFQSQLLASAETLASEFTRPWSFTFQSISGNKDAWLGPSIDDVVPTLAANGVKTILAIPIGFVCDHVEVLYDLDIDVRQQAEQHGMAFVRTPMPNDNPTFVSAVADAIQPCLVD